jgi:FtsH-binding integral membrane protein
MQNVWVIVFPILLIIGVFITAIFVPQVRRAPLDMVMLLVFIVSFSYLISMSCSAVVDIVEGPVVPIAVLATVGITLVLTIYAVVCKGNYSVMIGIAIVCGMTALVIGITAIFTRIPALTYVYCSLCISIFGIYLVIMTKLIIGGSYA